MRKKLATAALLLVTALGAQAQQQAMSAAPRDKTQSSPRLNPEVQARAKRLSTQMARDLRLNGYQASRLEAINQDKVAKMAAIEQKHADNPKLVDEQCLGVCKERDQELRAVLSNDQYSNYYDSRTAYYKFDKDFAARSSNILMVNSVQNPLPANSKGAVLAPSRTPAPANRGR
ncbi:hypothetical protein [Hymenobacter jejuensis]|uniref:DUF4142 domain-containing protein n=1 Tax=Hymenobacter jejuensis TaxID=2502781 RepID=A0A5B7ZUJ3_9BACT|nr:hypothetical protein [Hymenobacter jejuensis]QDA58638.1 hypothetical protein FHG12_00335 [Hymenobacter jejuensis]